MEVYEGGDCGVASRQGPTGTVTVPEPSLDGAAPGSGWATFSIAETDRIWAVGACQDTYSVSYR